METIKRYNMKANELRISNKLQKDNGEVFTVLRLDDTNDVLVEEQRVLTLGYNLFGIPLTEEWLLKFGAIVYDFDHQPNQYRISERLFVTRDGHFYDYGANVKLLYIHQLQNLYFALTGEELTIKETT